EAEERGGQNEVDIRPGHSGSLPQDERFESGLAAARHDILNDAAEGEADAGKDGEDDADGGVFPHASPAAEGGDDDDPEDAASERSQEHEGQIPLAQNQERHADS